VIQNIYYPGITLSQNKTLVGVNDNSDVIIRLDGKIDFIVLNDYIRRYHLDG
jgi:hypothetical protein